MKKIRKGTLDRSKAVKSNRGKRRITNVKVLEIDELTLCESCEHGSQILVLLPSPRTGNRPEQREA